MIKEWLLFAFFRLRLRNWSVLDPLLDHIEETCDVENGVKLSAEVLYFILILQGEEWMESKLGWAVSNWGWVWLMSHEEPNVEPREIEMTDDS